MTALGKTLIGQEKAIHDQCDALAKSNTEHAHQRAFFAWLAWMKHLNVYPKADRMFAIPNGGKRDPITAARLKAEGVKAGVPDTFYPVARRVDDASAGFVRTYFNNGLFLEFKKPGKGRESGEQIVRIETLLEDGYAVAAVYSWRAAVAAFMDYNTGREVFREYKETK
jgi:hypothetical protein